MKDFPMFTTEFGAASLVLREIPYRGEAFITLLSSEEPELLLEECVSFCRVCGAEKIYAKGMECLERYPLYTSVIKMCANIDRDAQCANLFPVTDKTVALWRKTYNEKMHAVDNARTLETRDEKQILESKGAYFVHDDGSLIGIGWVEDDMIRAVASVCPGRGMTVMNTLMALISGDTAWVEVASTNQKAIRLYNKLGFVPVAEKARWYQVFPEKIF